MTETDPTTARKYAIAEIEQMRNALRWSYPSGVSYYEKERSAEIENKLRTYMQNGTDPDELAAWSGRQRQAEQEAQQRNAAVIAAHVPNPRPKPTTVHEVLEEWFSDCVAQYPGASATLNDLYDGLSGQTLCRYANNNAPDGVSIGKRDLEKYLDSEKNIRSRRAMFEKRYDGIAVIMYGSIRSGNYGT
jgi:hypothetical protein